MENDGKRRDSPMGYIHDKLDVKMLVLYLMARITEPIGFDTLTELVMRHGVDYFVYAEAVSELVQSSHLQLSEELYSITDRGRSNSSACETSLPVSVRQRCRRDVAQINAILRRRAQVRGETRSNPDGSITARMTLDDDKGNLLTIELLCPSEAQADRFIAAFQARPERIYNDVLSALSTPEKED